MPPFDGHRLEFASPAEMRAIQEELLRRHLAYCAEASPYYRQLFREEGIDPGSITLETLHTLPLTDKGVFSQRNDEFLAVPMEQVVDIVLSSGTTARPATVMYTEQDLRRLAYNEEISFLGCGMSADDTVLLTCTIDRCFIAGLAYFSGARQLGAAVIRNGLNTVESHGAMIERFRPTVLVGVPTFLLKLGRYLQQEGMEPSRCGVTRLVCIGEPIRDESMQLLKVGAELERVWGARVYSTYASSETITSFCECTAQCGGHLHPDLGVVEIVDEEGRPVAPGTVGEVVMTPLAMEGMPLVRFKTGDISFLLDEPCACGRNSLRLGPILGRKSQMIKVRGTTLYPAAIYSALDGLAEVRDYYLEVTSDYALSDHLTVCVSLRDACCTAEALAGRLQAALRVRPDVVIVSDEQVVNSINQGNSRKINRFVDKRTTL